MSTPNVSFILLLCGMCNDVILMVCSDFLWIHVGCIRLACQLQNFLSYKDLYAKLSKGQEVNNFSIPNKM